MRFNGCGCKACKAVAVGAAGLFFANYVYRPLIAMNVGMSLRFGFIASLSCLSSPTALTAISGQSIGCEALQHSSRLRAATSSILI
jgi:hypothetical protein